MISPCDSASLSRAIDEYCIAAIWCTEISLCKNSCNSDPFFLASPRTMPYVGVARWERALKGANDMSMTLDELKAAMAQFSAADLKAAVKATTENKSTLLSVTMDCIAQAAIAGNVVSADVTKMVTARAREANVLKSDEEASATSVAQLIRHAQAYDSAMARAGYEWTKVGPDSTLLANDGSLVTLEPRADEYSASVVSMPKPQNSGTSERRKAA